MLYAGWLPKWLLVVSLLSVFNTAQCFLDTKTTLTRAIYIDAPEQVSPLGARTFGAWTLLSALIRFYAAFHIFNLTMATFLVALMHFASEWLYFGTTNPTSPGLVAPVVIASLTLSWMLQQYSAYTQVPPPTGKCPFTGASSVDKHQQKTE